MGFFSDFLTWLKGRNLCPSLMNDKQELEKLGEYEEENGLTGQLYLHKVLVTVKGENNQFEFSYYAVNSIPEKYAAITTGSNIEVPDFNVKLYSQGFVYDVGRDQNGTIFTAWSADSNETEENTYSWYLSILGRNEYSHESMSVSGYSVLSTEPGQSVSLTETVTPFNQQ